MGGLAGGGGCAAERRGRACRRRRARPVPPLPAPTPRPAAPSRAPRPHRTPQVPGGGYSGIRDVTAPVPEWNDRQESFWLAETLKYFWLLFSPADALSLQEWVLNTEAHPLKVMAPSAVRELTHGMGLPAPAAAGADSAAQVQRALPTDASHVVSADTNGVAQAGKPAPGHPPPAEPVPPQKVVQATGGGRGDDEALGRPADTVQ